MALKMLVCGDVRGEFDELFKRVNAVNKRNGPFEMLLCVGDFFGSNREKWEEYRTNPSRIAVHTYVLGPNKVEHIDYYSGNEGSELCDKVMYLGKSGLYSGGSGLQIAYVSGIGNDGPSNDTTFSPNDVEDLKTVLTDRSGFKGVDILLTSQWPKGVIKYAGAVEGNTPDSTASGALAQLALAVKPRYHFCGLEDIYYERLPYRNHRVLAEGAKHVTRFIALAAVGNPSKKKWLYAFTITPLSKMDNTELIKQPEDVTECPYQFEKIVKQDTLAQDIQQQYFYDLSSKDDNKLKRGRGSNDRAVNKRPKTRLPPLSSCWFCLSSSQVEKHLVVSVGDHNYLALAKGGLVSDHVLILPIGHCQATVGLDDEAVLEIDLFKSALRKFFKSQGKTVVFFERNYKSFHLQIQVVPLPLNKVEVVKPTFLDVADSQSIVLDEIPSHSDLKQIVNQGAPYFYVELPNGEKLLHRIRRHFPLQFGREVLASPPLLDLPEKIDWKACTLSKEEETHLVQDFRTAFQPFDFTL